MQGCSLAAHDLACRRGDRLLFAGLSLSLAAGEALHVLGANGIGKSSLLRILAGLLPPSLTYFESGTQPKRGTVAWQGSVGLLDGNLALDEHLPLGRALAFWRRVDGSELDVERLGIGGLMDVPVRYLSTGQRKRAAFARLIGQADDHWLLDEPLNGLDNQGVALVEDLIAERRAAGGVVVVASHQPIALPEAQVLDLREWPA